ncbi:MULTISPECIES: hypothetical protein [Methylosinus]|uniref:CYTH domain-containing protein n=1 Tax=Methylosinus trichosporium (strain ATCC 35070 / NCIMB 11131 / UNIQEM 75 / OB3b) TaxID=595536 RepID=A0A2D2D412_METT3|nr:MULTISPECIES: hypothetical protein [Methylosinus]ATQ69723.1 hypothetical protein CQW49_18910 [Methylosinus trichosporium OB3b]OBS52478.1 hypothetical protein A8B73_11550 [Methylosinus sp. 3S-1]
MSDAASDEPRWEWRIFGADLALLEAQLGYPLDAPHRSDEIYLVNSATPHSAKIRDGALEVKRLLRVDGDGLELWRPAFRAEFPFSADQLARAAAALALPSPPLRAQTYERGDFFSEIVARCRALRPIAVRKSRRRYAFRGCAAEAVRVQIGAVPLCSVAVESADAARLREALRALGADARLNVNFPKGVERAAALAA